MVVQIKEDYLFIDGFLVVPYTLKNEDIFYTRNDKLFYIHCISIIAETNPFF